MTRDASLEELRLRGYALLTSVVPVDDLITARLALYKLAEQRAGWRSTRKVHVEDIVGVDRSVDRVIENVAVARLVNAVLSGPTLWGARFRAPIQGYGEQTLHTDDDDGYIGPHRLITVIYPTDPFRPETGATRVVPRSHEKLPCFVPSDAITAIEGEIVVRADPGDALVMLGTTWHSGTRNISPSPRGAISVSYVDSNLWT